MRKTWLRRLLGTALCAIAMFAPAGLRGQSAGDAPHGDGPPFRDHSRRFPASHPVNGSLMLDVAGRHIDGLNLDGPAKVKAQQLLADTKKDFDSMTDTFNADNTPNDERLERYVDRLRMLRWQIWDLLPEDQKTAARELFGPGAFRGGGAGSPQQSPEEMLISNLRTHLDELNLDTDQKEQVKDILDSTDNALKDIRTQATRQGHELRHQFKIAIDTTKEKLLKVLTPPQQDELRDKLGNWLQDKRNTYDVNPQPGDDHPTTTTQPSSMLIPLNFDEQAVMLAADTSPPDKPAQAGPDVGQQAPDVSLKELDGLPVQLSSYKERVIVLEFGSYSCPSFRDRAAAMEQLKKDYGSRINLFVIYTREAFPAGGREVDRNKDDRIKVAQPADDEGRKNTARDARVALSITLPILLDTMDDKTAGAFHIFPDTPNACFVIDKDGIIAAAQKWTDPATLKHHIDEALKAPASASKPTA